MSATERAFLRAVARMQRPAAAKLFDPGLAPRLLARWRAGRQGRPVPARAGLFFGREMQVLLPEVTSQQLYTYGFFDQEVTWLALKSVRPGDTVFDVGAHFGYFSLLFRHLAGPEGRVVSFEPTPSTFNILRANAEGDDGIVAENLAAGAAPGNATIADFGPQYSAFNTLAAESRMPAALDRRAAAQVRVEVVRLDDYAAARGLAPGLIKIDAENFEYEVIAGAAGIIQRFRPRVIMETGSAPSLRAGEVLLAAGYVPHVCDGVGELRAWPGTLEDANRRYKDILFTPAPGSGA